MSQGKLIVIEGAGDGVGKTVQCNYLKERLQGEGYQVVSHHFPSYGSKGAQLVEAYLEGQLGDKEELSPYLVTSFYAMDRAYSFITELNQLYQEGAILLLDRYTTSTLIYQSIFFEGQKKKEDFFEWVNQYEYELLGLPQPDIVLFLTAPEELLLSLRKQRLDNEGIANDIHERDLLFLHQVYENAQMVADYFQWQPIECSAEGKLLSVEQIHGKVYHKVKGIL